MLRMSQAAKKAKRGFTLIEMLVVMVLIGILGTVIVAGVRIYISNANKTAAERNVKTVVTEVINASTTAGLDCDVKISSGAILTNGTIPGCGYKNKLFSSVPSLSVDKAFTDTSDTTGTAGASLVPGTQYSRASITLDGKSYCVALPNEESQGVGALVAKSSAAGWTTASVTQAGGSAPVTVWVPGQYSTGACA